MSYFKAKCTKFDFGSGSVPDPAGELTALPQAPQLDLRGPTSKRRKGRGKQRKREGEGKEGKGR